MKKWITAYAILIVLVLCGYIITTKVHNAKIVKDMKESGINTKQNIFIKKSKFSPETITIKKGEIVTWMNRDNADHSIQSETFRSINIKNGENFQYKFEDAGTFEYHCGIDPEMKGIVIVE